MQLRLSYFVSRWLGKNLRWGRYIALSVEPVNACNLACPQCPTGTDSITRKKGSLPMADYQKLLDEKAQDLWYLNFYFQGEPFLNRNLTEMIRMAHERKIYTSVSTNAQLINNAIAEKIVTSGLDRLIISIDGVTEDTYQAYRIGGTLERVLSRTKEVQAFKKKHRSQTPRVVFQFIVFKHNEHELEAMKQLAKDYQVDKLEIKSAQVYDFEHDTDVIPRNQKYSRYRKDNQGVYRIKSELSNHCWRMWHSAVVTEDLTVVPCCFDKDAEYDLGNLKQSSLQDIEGGKAYQKFRQSILTNRKQHEICRNCTEGLKS